ncbi:MAG: hypothetical protein HY548_03520 [Elusimicrobia bacterium]|nr:hypothetical protein [Elusimicrobiota bacterium]
MKTAEKPFQFVARLELTECTQWRAAGLEDLLRHVKIVPESVLYYHTHRFLRQHQYLSPEPPNDFAYWVYEILGERRLGEELASVDIIHVPSLEALRAEFVSRLGSYFSQGHADQRAPAGEEFYFMSAVTFTFPTPYRAFNLLEFAQGLRKVSIDTISHHVFDARLRNQRGANDFSLWLIQHLGEDVLAGAIERMDPYTQTLEGLRSAILRKIEDRLKKEGVHQEEAAPLAMSGSRAE